MSSDQIAHDPLMQAIIDLRHGDVSKEDQSHQFFMAFLPFLIGWLDCDSIEQVRESLKYGLIACERHGQCHCGHDMSEGHLRHGNGWTPPKPTALAEAWTETDQQEAYLEGWLLLVDRKDEPFIAAVPGGDLDAEFSVPEEHVREQAESGCEIARKAVALLDGEEIEGSDRDT